MCIFSFFSFLFFLRCGCSSRHFHRVQTTLVILIYRRVLQNQIIQNIMINPLHHAWLFPGPNANGIYIGNTSHSLCSSIYLVEVLCDMSTNDIEEPNCWIGPSELVICLCMLLYCHVGLSVSCRYVLRCAGGFLYFVTILSFHPLLIRLCRNCS